MENNNFFDNPYMDNDHNNGYEESQQRVSQDQQPQPEYVTRDALQNELQNILANGLGRQQEQKPDPIQEIQNQMQGYAGQYEQQLQQLQQQVSHYAPHEVYARENNYQNSQEMLRYIEDVLAAETNNFTKLPEGKEDIFQHKFVTPYNAYTKGDPHALHQLFKNFISEKYPQKHELYRRGLSPETPTQNQSFGNGLINNTHAGGNIFEKFGGSMESMQSIVTQPSHPLYNEAVNLLGEIASGRISY